jgi:thymidylate synthase
MKAIDTATTAWRSAINDVLDGDEVAPRGKPTLEVAHRTDHIDMRRPVLLSRVRALSYRFMVAEAYWILSGSNQLSGVEPYAKRMAEFSDDGQTLFGAYGPPIVSQLDYVVGKLLADSETRQAALTIWRPNPPPTKDTPCTVAMVFRKRHNKLHAHVFMRSNDLWLGWPYDVFSFSMVAHLICCRLNEAAAVANATHPESLPIGITAPGVLHLTAASSHLYEPEWSKAIESLNDKSSVLLPAVATPADLWMREHKLMETLRELRDTSPGHELRWWEPKAD